jgi:hypothetical protein
MHLGFRDESMHSQTLIIPKLMHLQFQGQIDPLSDVSKIIQAHIDAYVV